MNKRKNHKTLICKVKSLTFDFIGIAPGKYTLIKIVCVQCFVLPNVQIQHFPEPLYHYYIFFQKPQEEVQASSPPMIENP